jgi:hypothetical protein
MTVRADEIAFLNLFQYSRDGVPLHDHLSDAHELVTIRMIEVHAHGWVELVTVHTRAGFLYGVDEILALLVLASLVLGPILHVGLIITPTLRLTVVLFLIAGTPGTSLLIHTIMTTTLQPVLITLCGTEL